MKSSTLNAVAALATFATGAVISYMSGHSIALNDTGAAALDVLRIIGPVFMGAGMLAPFFLALESISRPEGDA